MVKHRCRIQIWVPTGTRIWTWVPAVKHGCRRAPLFEHGFPRSNTGAVFKYGCQRVPVFEHGFPQSNTGADGHPYLNIGPHGQRTQYIYSCLVTIINSTFQLPKTNGLIITIITLVENSYIEPKEGLIKLNKLQKNNRNG